MEIDPHASTSVSPQHADTVRAAAGAVSEYHYPFTYGGRTYCPPCNRTWPCVCGALVEAVLRLIDRAGGSDA